MIKDWGQTDKTVTFQCRMANIALKQIDIQIYDHVVKLNIQERREVLLIDLYDKVDGDVDFKVEPTITGQTDTTVVE